MKNSIYISMRNHGIISLTELTHGYFIMILYKIFLLFRSLRKDLVDLVYPLEMKG